jgi:hypothetical protein
VGALVGVIVMDETSTITDQLNAEHVATLLKQCGFEVNDQEPDAGGWIPKIEGPACLGAAEGADFRVNVETGEVLSDAQHGYRGSLLHVIERVHGLSPTEAEGFVMEVVRRHEVEDETESTDDRDAPQRTSSMRYVLETSDEGGENRDR